LQDDGEKHTYLIIFGCKFIETFLDNMVAVEVLNQHDDVSAQSKYDGVYLRVEANVGLERGKR
jgi:hypothetical protein